MAFWSDSPLSWFEWFLKSQNSEVGRWPAPCQTHQAPARLHTLSMDFSSSQDANSLITLNPVTAVPYLVLVWLYASHKIWVGSVSTKWTEVLYHSVIKTVHVSETNHRRDSCRQRNAQFRWSTSPSFQWAPWGIAGTWPPRLRPDGAALLCCSSQHEISVGWGPQRSS